VSGDGRTRAIFDAAAFERQTGGDAALRAEIVEMFLEDCPARAAEIRAAVESQDAPALVSSAHALKGSAAYLSASIVRGCAAELENAGREQRLADARAMLAALEAAVSDLLAELKNSHDQ
jgi:HPt (histidine-containing phosphotransfer) domain-containing protein